jgi:hypothetical protein
MLGNIQNSNNTNSFKDSNPDKGIMIRSVEYLFSQMTKTTSPKINYYVSASYLELYNDTIIDLLAPSNSSQDLLFRFNNKDV